MSEIFQDHRGTSQFAEIKGKIMRRPDFKHHITDANGRLQRLAHGSFKNEGPRPVVKAHMDVSEGVDTFSSVIEQEPDVQGHVFEFKGEPVVVYTSGEPQPTLKELFSR